MCKVCSDVPQTTKQNVLKLQCRAQCLKFCWKCGIKYHTEYKADKKQKVCLKFLTKCIEKKSAFQFGRADKMQVLEAMLQYFVNAST